MTFKQCTSGKS